MIKLTGKQIEEYLHRCYTAVDGLWFMKLEDKFGFETALEIDDEVWKIMPKVQARMLKSMGNAGNGIDGMCECIETKLDLDGFKFTIKKHDSGQSFSIIISECPWYTIMKKSKREHLAGKVGNSICNSEYSAWTREFEGDLNFDIQERICEGSSRCIIRIYRNESS